MAVELSPRQRDVIVGIAEGKKYHEIATELELTYETVKTYVRRLRKKLKLNSKVQLAIWALNNKVHHDGGVESAAKR